MKKWKSWKCRCGVSEGQLHKLDCEYEVCPFCGWQLIACECRYKKLGIDCSKGTWAYSHGLTKKQEAQFEEILTKKGRIPDILIPNHCGLCGEQWPKGFHVSNAQWEKFVIPPLQKEELCLECFQELKSIFPKGWREVNELPHITSAGPRTPTLAQYSLVLSRHDKLGTVPKMPGETTSRA